MILEIGSKGFVGPSIFWPLKMGLKRRKVENHWFSRHRDCVIGEAFLTGAKKGRRLNNVLSYQINSTKFQKTF